MPTPAARATASRLASAPPALNTALAASSTRSRWRTASARGLRELFPDGFDGLVFNCRVPIVLNYPGALEKRRYPPYIAIAAGCHKARAGGKRRAIPVAAATGVVAGRERRNPSGMPIVC